MSKIIRGKIISITPIADQPEKDEVLIHYLDLYDGLVETETHQVARDSAGAAYVRSMVSEKCRTYNTGYASQAPLQVEELIHPFKIHTFIATTLLGIATFTLTDDGLPTGQAIFSAIEALQVTPERDVTSVAQTVSGSIKTVSPDKKIVIANVVRESGNFAIDGTKVYLTVIGK